MAAKVGVGLLGLGTVGGGVASILQNPSERHPLVGELELIRVAVRDLNRPRPVALDESLLTTDPSAVIQDPAVDAYMPFQFLLLISKNYLNQMLLLCCSSFLL